LVFHTSLAGTTAEKMRIASDGSVGIGTTTTSAQHPDATLYVKGGIDFSESTSATEGSTPAITQWSTDGTAQDLVIGARSGTGEVLFFTGNAGSAGDWGASSNAERMRITHDGKVGIGTDSPARSLSVQTTSSSYGMARFTRDSTTHGEASIGFEHSSDATDAETWVVGTGGWSNTDDFVIGQGGAKFLIETSTGNVGIGVTDPAEKLEVAGSILIDYALAHRGDSNNQIVFTTDTQTFKTDATDRLTIASDGDVTVAGAFYATTKEFLIDHPTKPDMKLHHGSLEGPEHGVYIRGKSSSSTVELPEYWTGLVDEDSITVQVTPIGKSQELYVKSVSGREVKIGTDIFGQRLNFFYFIQAERKDVDKLVVEV